MSTSFTLRLTLSSGQIVKIATLKPILHTDFPLKFLPAQYFDIGSKSFKGDELNEVKKGKHLDFICDDQAEVRRHLKFDAVCC